MNITPNFANFEPHFLLLPKAIKMLLSRCISVELKERNIIIDDTLSHIAEAGMEGYITHAYCSVGECEVWYGGSLLHFRRGDCMIDVVNQQGKS